MSDPGITIYALERTAGAAAGTFDGLLLPAQPIQWSLIDINTLNLNQAGSFTVECAATDLNWQLIQFDSEGDFIPFPILVDWHGRFQVPLLVETYQAVTSVDSTTGTVTDALTFTGSDFLTLLAARVAFPNGALPWTQQTGQPFKYSGPAETVIKDIVSKNCVTPGDPARKIPNFVIAPNQERGESVTYTITPPVPAGTANGLPAPNLGASLMDVIRTIAGQTPIGVSITLENGQLVFDCFIPRDLSNIAVFATGLGNLRGDSISDGIPTADVALIQSATTEVFTTTQLWTCPPGVTSVDVECWGGGGGGAGAPSVPASAGFPKGGGTSPYFGGGGGGGGEFARATIPVTPGQQYWVFVGDGGQGGNHDQPGSGGGESAFTGDGDNVTAHGGQGAAAPSTHNKGSGAPGGQGSGAEFHRDGGDGADGAMLQANKNGTFGGYGGGGGSSASIGASGRNAKDNIGGTGAPAPPSGGKGGDAGSYGGGTSSDGQDGTAPGGGGGGGGIGVIGGQGGNGGLGQVQIVYLSAGQSAFIESDATGNAATDPWRRAESYSDQTGTASATDIATAIQNILLQGAAQQSLTVTALDTPMLMFGTPPPPAIGYQLGDYVTVEIRDGVTYTDQVTAVELAASTTGYVYLPQSLVNNAVFQTTAPAAPGGANTSSYVEFVAATLGSQAQPQGNVTATGQIVANGGGSGSAVAQASAPTPQQIPAAALDGVLLAPGAALTNIGPGNIDAGYLQEGIVVAGIVDGTIIEGATIEAGSKLIVGAGQFVGPEIIAQLLNGAPIIQFVSNALYPANPAVIDFNIDNIGAPNEYETLFVLSAQKQANPDQAGLICQSGFNDGSQAALAQLSYFDTSGAFAGGNIGTGNGGPFASYYDGQNYRVGYVSHNIQTQTVTNSPTVILAAHQVAAGDYDVDIQIIYQGSASTAGFTFFGPASSFSAVTYLETTVPNAGGTGTTSGLFADPYTANFTGQPMASTSYHILQVKGKITFTASGQLQFVCAATTSGDNVNIQGHSYMRVMKAA